MVSTIDELLQIAADIGIFYYVLPFLLLFALTFAILQKMNLTGKDNRGIDAIIALAVSLLALQFDMVPMFFQEIFPRAGMGLGILLVALILMGLFVNPQKHTFAVWTFFSIGAVLAIIILLNSLESYSWWAGGWWTENMDLIITGAIIIALVTVVIMSGKAPGKPFGKFNSPTINQNP